jgi:asparagine synthase (glutamine-hydrolysing)
MCGIAGIVDLKASREIDRAALKRMTDALAHRGPDGEGFYIAPGVGFGHRRLAVIDIEGGAQPFHTQERNCVLSFNGEIYNHTELGAELRSKGIPVRTRSDTEILAEGWAHDGADFVHKLRGMFAFSFWEPEQRRLTLARDRLGERPLYYAQTDDGFLIFASELGAILVSGMIERNFNPEAVADYFYYGFVPDPKTIYRDVYKLPPAHILVANRSEGIRLERYWRPVFASSNQLNFNEAAEILREKIDDAVSTQSIADVPFGAFLSGGVDSAGIVASMRQTGNRLVTCTVGFNEAEHDERSFARDIAAKFDAEHHEHLAGLDIFSLIDKVAAAFDEPFADSSALASYVAAKLARQHVTVALSGDGGDELFAGYRRYPFYLAEEKARSYAPLPIRRVVFGPAGALYPKLDWAPRPLRFKTTFQSLAQTRAEGYAAAVAINLPMRARAILSRDLRRKIRGYRPSDHITAAMADADTNDTLAHAQYADFLTWLPGRMLTKIDRASMAHGLEVRPPLLDHQLVEWAGLLPTAFKLQNGVGKRVLKEALSPRLGREFLNRKKQGFDLPIAQWLRSKDNNPLVRLNASRLWRDCGLIDDRAVDRMAVAHQRGQANCAQELWSVIMFDAFLRNVHCA